MSFVFASSHLPETRVQRPEDEEEEDVQPMRHSGGVRAFSHSQVEIHHGMHRTPENRSLNLVPWMTWSTFRPLQTLRSTGNLNRMLFDGKAFAAAEALYAAAKYAETEKAALALGGAAMHRTLKIWL